MSKVVVVGATGYTGTNICRELVERGHEVIAVARDTSRLMLDEVTPIEFDLEDTAKLAEVARGADAVILAVPHRAVREGGPVLADIITDVAAATAATGTRLGVVGGAGSLFVAEGGPRLFDTPEFPAEFRTEAMLAFDTLEAMQTLPANTHWFYLSPAAGYGSFNPGERQGKYRTSKDVLVSDENGMSFISGVDFAKAIVDELENPQHENERFTVGY